MNESVSRSTEGYRQAQATALECSWPREPHVFPLAAIVPWSH